MKKHRLRKEIFIYLAEIFRTPSFLVCLAVFSLVLSSDIKAQDSAETVWIPMTEKRLLGSRTIKLEATLYKPQGDGPFPVVVFNHGSTGPGIIPAKTTVDPQFFGAYLVRRKIVLLAPMRRGRGKSEGAYREPYVCNLSLARRGVHYAMKSLDSTFEWLASQRWADMGKVLLSGSSRGGILSVLYAANRPGQAIGAINFAGGWMSDTCNNYTLVDINIALFEEAGLKSKVPNLFLYGYNDAYYTTALINSYARTFEKAGGEVEYRLFDLGADSKGHRLFWNYHPQWIYDVDQFFVDLGVLNL